MQEEAGRGCVQGLVLVQPLPTPGQGGFTHYIYRRGVPGGPNHCGSWRYPQSHHVSRLLTGGSIHRQAQSRGQSLRGVVDDGLGWGMTLGVVKGCMPTTRAWRPGVAGLAQACWTAGMLLGDQGIGQYSGARLCMAQSCTFQVTLAFTGPLSTRLEANSTVTLSSSSCVTTGSVVMRLGWSKGKCMAAR